MKFEKLKIPELSKAELRDEKEKKELEAKGWRLVSDGIELTTEDRTKEDIEDEYWEKYKDENFWQLDLAAKHKNRSDGEIFWSPNEFFVFMRRKEDAEKEKERTKEIRKELIKMIREVLKEMEFSKDKRDKSTWQRKLDDVIQVFNLQTSSFSRSYMINLGIFLRKKDESMENPKYLDCPHQYRKRLGGFISNSELRRSGGYNEAMDFSAVPNEYEGEPPEQEKIEKIREYLKEYAVPFFEASQTEEGVKKFIEELKEKYARGEME